jgi:glutamate-5-semialdehyde dehydrogenase
VSALTEQARRARVVARVLATLTRGEKDAALHACADALLAASEHLVQANQADVAAARAAGTDPAVVDRLTLTPGRVEDCAAGLRQVAGLPDPVGEVVRGSTLASGLEMRQVRVPFGVVGMVYEARPNVTVDAAGICLKSGNAVLLRGSSSAAATNSALVEVLRSALGELADAVQLVDSSTRDTVKELLTMRGEVDLVIPRGGASLIRTVVEQATVPVIETGVGNCHVYVDAAADLAQALPIVLNAKVQRPSVCNAAETLLVHRDVAQEFLAMAIPALQAAGVTVHGCPRTAEHAGVLAATEADWETEYLSLDLAVRVVDSYDEAVAHVRRFSSGHTEAICTRDARTSRAWVADIDAAAVVVNASTRFTDGAELGFGAEIGISTQKLHARGPMALPEMTTTKYVLTGDGQIRS